MGDLLIRDVPDAMKRQLQESAQRNGRSLSEEAIEIIRRQIAVGRSGASRTKRVGPDAPKGSGVAARNKG